MPPPETLNAHALLPLVGFPEGVHFDPANQAHVHRAMILAGEILLQLVPQHQPSILLIPHDGEVVEIGLLTQMDGPELARAVIAALIGGGMLTEAEADRMLAPVH